MKKQILLLSIFLSFSLAQVQSQSFNEINVNNIKTGMHSNGNLFFDEGFNSGNFQIVDSGLNPASTIFGSGVWISGINLSGNIKAAYVSYSGANPEEYTPGPINQDILGTNSDQVWKVTKEDIEAHILDFVDGTIDEEPSDNIIEWPAAGNVFYSPALPTDQLLAPFFDADQNGVYDPYLGDYPIIGIGNETIGKIPSVMLFTIFNSDHPSFSTFPQVEIHTLMYAFGCTASEGNVLNNTIFTRHKIINKASESYRGFKYALWQDSDLGCHTDDLIGCDTTLNAFFTYNEDSVDGNPGTSCGGTSTFGENPPVQSSVFLNQKMESFYAYYNAGVGDIPTAAQDPNDEYEYYQNMNGVFNDGTPITIGGNGYNPGSTDVTKYVYHGDPNDPNEWSMIANNIPSNDPRVVASTGLESFEPEQILTVDLAHIYTSVATSNNIETVTDAKIDIANVQALYDQNFEGACGIVNSTEHLKFDHIKVFPNPSQGVFYISQSDEFDRFILSDKLGRTITTGIVDETTTEVKADVTTGVYLLRLVNENNGLQVHRKLIIH